MFKYLRFTLNKEGNYEDHLDELKRKGIVAAKKSWGLGERMKKNLEGKCCFSIWLNVWWHTGRKKFDWKFVDFEKIQLDYVRWVLRMDFCTPRYIVYEETDTWKTRTDWVKRAIKYEEKIYELEDYRLVKRCWREKVQRNRSELCMEERSF